MSEKEDERVIQDFSSMSDEEIKKMLKNIILSRCMDLTEPVGTLKLAVDLYYANEQKNVDLDEELSIDEIKQKLQKYGVK